MNREMRRDRETERDRGIRRYRGKEGDRGKGWRVVGRYAGGGRLAALVRAREGERAERGCVSGGGAIDRMALVASGSKKSRRAESGAVGKACIRATSG